MSKPVLTIRKSDLTRNGSLSTRHLDEVSQLLADGGLVLLPSDTCYSLSGSVRSGEVANRVNFALRRNVSDPISVSAANVKDATFYLEDSPVASALFDHFTPGPITVVAQASASIRKQTQLIEMTIKSQDGTIGMRIPDSVIERDLCAMVRNGLLTTTAVRQAADTLAQNTIREFDRAFNLVAKGMARLKTVPWAAIEGDAFRATHSTVVRIEPRGNITILREGDIAKAKIEAVVAALPRSMRY